MDPQEITSLTEDEMWKIEDDLSDVGKKIGGGGKSGHKGPKTSKAISSSQKENAERKRIEESKIYLKNDLKHFPFELSNEDENLKIIEKYSEWVLDSLPSKYPVFNNLDEEIKYIQSRSSGPGGQNVNKTSTAVMAKHLLTGIFSRSEDSREVIVNKRNSSSKLFSLLENHIKSWSVYLKNIPQESRKPEITSFIQKLLEEKSS
ncbi:hypothetical protein K0B04_01135 [Patescibacteria group bacterium]|nr:hypothetical protein [Patescibacteria group bacterium]